MVSLANFLDLHSVAGAIFTTEKDCQEIEWVEFLLKLIDTKQEPTEKCFPILNKLLLLITQHPDMHKVIQSKFMQKIIEAITSNTPSTSSIETLLTCLKHYGGTSGVYKNKIFDFLTSFINSPNADLIKLAGKSLHSLQQTRGGSVAGSIYKKNWADFHEKLLNTIDAELDILFDCEDTVKTGKSERLKLPDLNRNGDQKEQTPLMYANLERFIRFRNLCIILETGLLQSFPAAKTIQLNRIVGSLVDKGIALNQAQINNKSGDSKLPSILHVEIQKSLLNVLKCVILAVGGNILTCSKDICDILWKCLKGTNISYDELKADSNSSLRKIVYDVLNVFLRVAPNNHFMYKNMENLMKEAFVDITPIQTEIVLTLPQASGGGEKSKKKKKENAMRKTISGNAIDKSLHLHQMLCSMSLEFLRNLLLFNGAAMKPVFLKILQDKILMTTFKFISLELTENDLYNSIKCRSNMLELIFVIQTHPPIRNATPMSFFIEILSKFKDNDRELELRQRAMEMLRSVEGMLHCRKDPIHFPNDLREFRDHWLFNEKTVKAFEKLDVVESNMWKNQQQSLTTEIARNESMSVVDEGNAEIDDDDEVEIVIDEVVENNGNIASEIVKLVVVEEKEEIKIEEVITKDDDQIIRRSKRTAPKSNDEQPKIPKMAKKAEIIEEKNDDDDDALVNLYFNDFDCE